MRATHMLHRIAGAALGGIAAVSLLASLQPPQAFMIQTAHAQDEAGQTWNVENGSLGWGLAGQVQTIPDGIDPLSDDAMRSVAQGQYSVMTGDSSPWAEGGDQFGALERTTVPQSDGKPMLQFSSAVVANDPPAHAEPAKPYFQLEVRDLTTGDVLPVSNFKQWSLWSACLLLPLLIALALALMYFFRPRAVSPAQNDGLTVAQPQPRRVSTATVGSTWHDPNRPLDSGEQPQGSQK